MVARRAKEANGNRRRSIPVRAIEQELNELNVAEASAVLIAPAEASHSIDQVSSLEPVGSELDRLYSALELVTPDNHPRTARLLGSGTRKVAQKVIEEAGEVALEAVRHNRSGVVRESADLLYHLAVLWRRARIDPAEIWAEMRRRADSLGIAEKLPKPNL
jgi:phosphoribosyl-ATP pyrophosphohydrolase